MNKYAPYYLLGLYLSLGFILTFTLDGTGDAGDSVLHYLYARYAPVHPELFFNHWAKPLFVLLAAPFAQFGFVGIKVFNLLVLTGTLYLCYLSARQLGYQPALVAAIIMALMPLSFTLTFSGLTEPLFALMVAGGLALALSGRNAYAALLVSFLPFVRSEGLLFLGIYGLYFMWRRQWAYLPLLLVGHLAYALAGYLVYKDVWWVFTKIPYANLGSVYGHGTLFHFVDQLFYAAGLPVFVLFGVGVLRVLWEIFRKESGAEQTLLVLGGFMAFFLFHSLAWYWGMFNSMGMKRVLLGVGPLTALLALKGFQALSTFTKRPAIVQVILLGLVLVFPFIGSPSSIHWNEDMRLNKDQQTIKRVAEFIRASGNSGHRIVGVHPYVSMSLGLDHFDSAERIPLDSVAIQHWAPGDVVIWENWFAPLEFGVTREMIESKANTKQVFEISTNDHGRTIRYVVYEIIILPL